MGYLANNKSDLPSRLDLQSTFTIPERKHRALDARAMGHTMGWAARYAGVSRMQLYNWKNEDPAFASALEEYKEHYNDAWEDRLFDLAHQDKQLHPAVTAAIVGLKIGGRFVENAPSGSGAPIQVQVINVILPPGAPVPQSLPGAGTIDLLPPP